MVTKHAKRVQKRLDYVLNISNHSKEWVEYMLFLREKVSSLCISSKIYEENGHMRYLDLITTLHVQIRIPYLTRNVCGVKCVHLRSVKTLYHVHTTWSRRSLVVGVVPLDRENSPLS